VVAHRAGDDHIVPRADIGRGKAGVFQKADAGGVDIDPVAPAALDDLGVAGDDFDARLFGGGADRVYYTRKFAGCKALLDQKSAA
jgi:hypothetical protein